MKNKNQKKGKNKMLNNFEIQLKEVLTKTFKVMEPRKVLPQPD